MSLSHLFISSRLQLERVKQRRSGKDNFYRSTLASPATRYVTLLCLMKERNWICPSGKLQSSYCITIDIGPLLLVIRITKDIYVIKYITYNMNLQSKHISRVDEQQCKILITFSWTISSLSDKQSSGDDLVSGSGSMATEGENRILLA